MIIFKNQTVQRLCLIIFCCLLGIWVSFSHRNNNYTGNKHFLFLRVFFACHFFPYTKQNINSEETPRGSCEGGQGKPILVPKCKKVFFPLDSIKIQTMKIGKKKWPPHLSIFLDVVLYQDLSRPSASLAHCCIHDNLYFLAYFAFLNHKCKIKATKTNQVEKELN